MAYRTARGLLIIACLVLQSCAANEAPPGPSILDRKTRWMGCVASSYGLQRQATPDRNLAAEIAFQACASEERAILAHLGADPVFIAEASALIAKHKADLKRDLVNLR